MTRTSTRIVHMQFGSRLYGTATPDSDLDYKGVFLPDGHDILLQRVRESVTGGRRKARGEKNAPGELDEEHFSLQRYLSLLEAGHPAALDMLFAPERFWTGEPTWHWHEIRENADRILSRKALSIVSYVRTQSKRYAIGASHMAAASAALSLLEDGISRHGASARLESLEAAIEAAVAGHNLTALVPEVTDNGKTIVHWQVCGRKMAWTASIGNARDTMRRLVDECGQRALMTDGRGDPDWKPLSHAIRIGRQAVELFETGAITLPRPDAGNLLDIKLGRLPYRDVAAEMEELPARVEAAVAASPLPAEPDSAWVEDFVAGCHRDMVLDWRPGARNAPATPAAEDFSCR